MASAEAAEARLLERRELGSTGIKVSCVGFGASPLGNVFGPVSDDEALAAVRRAFELGINFFDTSPYYGGTVSESVLGRCLRALGVPRSEFFVSTKCGRYIDGFDFSAERVTRSVDESLSRLGLDYVDFLQCHDIEFGSLDQIVSETIPAIQKLKEAGKIFNYVLDRVPQESVDVILSYCHYSINDSSLLSLLPYLEKKGVGVISASPLAMGLLTDNGPPNGIRPRRSSRLLIRRRGRDRRSPCLLASCRAAADHCRGKGKNISHLALQYSLGNKGVASVLVGMNSVKQVEENVAAAMEQAANGIDEELLKEVEAILGPVKNQTWPSGIQQG
ncbi:unnamed protein product [Spirodela intermedia]|uniref:NADP-dependent oxidoreductase domain-containing protein n=1 Tax=Spirodela intermedia TaxID=51605 RepID=A0A7I8I7R8_SPIIN|nr:unnamed protein product [Spirodela intermedia]CAA6653504.1 unnamed protein product [Spirodela intermedia]